MTGKILIIEDDQFLRDICEQKFRQMGFTVETAVDGTSGLEKILSGKPTIILLDIILPAMDGFEILQKVRANPDQSVKSIPIILLSNLGQESEIAKGMQLGANDYLVKTYFTMDQIVEKVKVLLEGKRVGV